MLTLTIGNTTRNLQLSHYFSLLFGLFPYSLYSIFLLLPYNFLSSIVILSAKCVPKDDQWQIMVRQLIDANVISPISAKTRNPDWYLHWLACRMPNMIFTGIFSPLHQFIVNVY